MRLRIDIRIGLENDPVGPNEVGNPFRQRDQGASSADRLRQLAIAVAEQAELEVVFFGEFPVLLWAVVGNTENFDAELLEFVPAVPQLVGFESSTGGAGLWIEEEQKRATFEIGT